MIALDTNVLVRFLTQDDPVQAAAAKHIVESAQNRGERLFVPLIVLCELGWVLSYSYELSKADFLAALDGLLISNVFEIERIPQVNSAIAKYRSGRAGFADYLIGEVAAAAGCIETVTFDRKLKGSAGFRIL